LHLNLACSIKFLTHPINNTLLANSNRAYGSVLSANQVDEQQLHSDIITHAGQLMWCGTALMAPDVCGSMKPVSKAVERRLASQP
jgi:hypothetical protein